MKDSSEYLIWPYNNTNGVINYIYKLNNSKYVIRHFVDGKLHRELVELKLKTQENYIEETNKTKREYERLISKKEEEARIYKTKPGYRKLYFIGDRTDDLEAYTRVSKC